MTEAELILIVVITAPVVETAIFQLIAQEILIRYLPIATTKYKLYIAACVSALLFSLTHYYSILYILMTFLSGLLYSGLYLVVRRGTGGIGLSFLSACLTHILFNLSEYLIYK
ncbi:MAG TPA: CPBP family intramembrane glutamic endopeptidase [Cyclobacteriaceae bacterium]|nr:CPBP family intramembrane glutamic endopeptidase [Cyclobacteriaceae bacterium]